MIINIVQIIYILHTWSDGLYFKHTYTPVLFNTKLCKYINKKEYLKLILVIMKKKIVLNNTIINKINAII